MTTMEATFEGMPGLIAPARSTAQSDSAKVLDVMLETIREELLYSYVMSSPAGQVLDELEEVRKEASREGWDGYGARPLNPLSYDFAIRFLNALPAAAPIPEISADPEGEVSLDWIFGERKALTVSIGPAGRCTFAWMLGQSTNRGTGWIEDEIPAPIIFALGELARGTTTKQAR
ncbi:MAG: hypothetical protein WBE72_17510 [Terracidiphilus sp.]